MSLKVWLPLTGNLENKGLSEGINFTQSSLTYSDGKIGQCAYFNNIKTNTVTIPNFNGTKQFSIALWIKLPSSSSSTAWADVISFTASNGSTTAPFRLEHVNNTLNWYCNGVLTDSGGIGSYTTVNVTNNDIWHHLTITKDSANFYLYLDGNLYITKVIDSSYINSYLTGPMTIGDNTGSYFYANDIRVYDHCLSAKEVKEISQGLVLHYKLDKISEDNNGEFYILDSSGYGHNGIIYDTLSTTSGSVRYNDSMTFNNSARIYYNDFNIGNIWSYGCWVYSAKSSRGWEGIMVLNNSGSDADCQFGFWTYPTGNRIESNANGQYNSSISFTYGQWNHFFATFDGSSLKTYINGSLVYTQSITNSWLSRAHLTIGARSSNASGAGAGAVGTFLGQISDARIYATAFTAEEVLELYNNPVNVDNLGDIHSFEFNEVETTNLSDFSLTSSNWVSDGVTATYTTEHNIGDIVKMVPSSGNKRIYHNVSNVWTSGKVYLVSLWAKADSSGAVIRPSRSIADFATPNFNLTTEWKQYYGIINCTTTVTGGTLSISYSGSTNIPCYISHIKLEEANKNFVSILKTGIFKENWIDEENFTTNAKILKNESVIVGREFIEK